MLYPTRRLSLLTKKNYKSKKMCICCILAGRLCSNVTKKPVKNWQYKTVKNCPIGFIIRVVTSGGKNQLWPHSGVAEAVRCG